MWEYLVKFASPVHFYALANRLAPWFGRLSVALFILGLYGALFYAPPDYQQGESFRIIYVHVPSAWMSMFVYVVMATAGAAGLIWKTKLADAIARNCAPLGASFTFLALVTGAIDDRRTAARAGAVLALVGVVNIPIIHYSVIWWNTLHQGPTVTKLDAPSIHIDMLIPLLVMGLAFMCYFIALLLVRARCDVLEQERNSKWVRELEPAKGFLR